MALCKKFNDSGDKKTAIEHMRRKKELEKQLADYTAQFEESKSVGEDVVELEEQYHDSEGMCAVSVLEHEIQYLKDKVKVRSPEQDYFLTKIETLEFQKSALEDNVGNGIITPDKYLKNLKAYRDKQTKLL